MKRHLAEFLSKCIVCQQVKAEHQKPAGSLQPLGTHHDGFCHRIPPGDDTIWVIVDRLTKSAHFLPLTWPMEKLALAYIDEIVRLHGVPVSIVSDLDPSRFWRQLQTALGTKLEFSTAYHPQTDGQSERTIQTLEDMLRTCLLEMQEIGRKDWESRLPLVEFAYNNGYHSSIGMAPFEALYERKCRTPVCWSEVGERVLLGPELLDQTTDMIRIVQRKMKAAQDRQKSYADTRRRSSLLCSRRQVQPKYSIEGKIRVILSQAELLTMLFIAIFPIQ